MTTFIDNTTDKIETYTNGTMICAHAYVVIMDDIHIAFDTEEEAKDYAGQFVFYHIELQELVLDQLDGCIYDPASILAKEE
jgi:hypothetical protein